MLFPVLNLSKHICPSYKYSLFGGFSDLNINWKDLMLFEQTNAFPAQEMSLKIERFSNTRIQINVTTNLRTISIELSAQCFH